MLHLRATLIAALTVALLADAPSAPAGEGATLRRIAFGSCLKQDEPAPILDRIVAAQPDLFIFAGDNIYADTEDMDLMRERYASLGRSPGYQRLRAAAPILSTWDDHDYGANDAGAEYPRKEESQRMFLEFFGVPRSSPRWHRPGVYSAQLFGPPERRVQVILLDTRYFRSPLQRREWYEYGNGRRFEPVTDPQATVLGEDQWDWLAGQLRQPARLRIFVSSIQVIPHDHNWEKWANFPLERQRLLDLIRESRAGGVIIISGDRHLGEISRLGVDQGQAPGYPLYEVTSSGLNSGFAGFGEHNRHRIGERNYNADNFGLIHIDWATPDPTLTLEIRNALGHAVISHRLTLSELQAAAPSTPNRFASAVDSQ
jgi:alkaline phosphatase D